jgi:protocatechuate 3,4-dioxygenase beta subunit
MGKSYMYGEVSLHSFGFSRTDDRGVYRISNLKPGTYYVRASAPEFDTLLHPSASNLAGAQAIDIATGSDHSGVNFVLRRAPRFKIEGRLIDAETGGPAHAASLRVESADLITGVSADGMVHDGHFWLRNLAPGRYFLYFSWLGPTNDVRREVVIPYEMKPGDRSEVVLAAPARVTVSGRVKAGGELSQLSIGLEPTAAAIRAHGGNWASTILDEHGNFEIKNVEAGDYRWYIHSPTPEPFFLPERNIKVDGTVPITGIELTLDSSAGSVSGRAVDDAGKPMPHAIVVLQSVDPDKRVNDLYRHVYSADGSGEYHVPGVVPGEYLLFVWKGDSGLIGDPDLFKVAAAHAERISLQPSMNLRKDAALLSGPR